MARKTKLTGTKALSRRRRKTNGNKIESRIALEANKAKGGIR